MFSISKRVWSSGVTVQALDLQLKRLLVQVPAAALSGNLGQAIHT